MVVVFRFIDCNDSGDSGGLHDVIPRRRAVHQDHQAGGEVAQRALEGEADNEADGPDPGHQRPDVDAQHRQGDHNNR
jgi:hypothetical protein